METTFGLVVTGGGELVRIGVVDGSPVTGGSELTTPFLHKSAE